MQVGSAFARFRHPQRCEYWGAQFSSAVSHSLGWEAGSYWFVTGAILDWDNSISPGVFRWARGSRRLWSGRFGSAGAIVLHLCQQCCPGIALFLARPFTWDDGSVARLMW